MKPSRIAIALAGTLVFAATAHSAEVTQLRSSGKAAQATFIMTEGGITTIVTVFSSNSTERTPPLKPVLQPDTVLEVIRIDAATEKTVFSGIYSGPELAPVFTQDGRIIIATVLNNSFTMEVLTPETTSTTARIYLEFRTTGAHAIFQNEKDRLVSREDGLIVHSHVRGTYHDATAAGTLVIGDEVFNLSTDDAQIQENRAALISIQKTAM